MNMHVNDDAELSRAVADMARAFDETCRIIRSDAKGVIDNPETGGRDSVLRVDEKTCVVLHASGTQAKLGIMDRFNGEVTWIAHDDRGEITPLSDYSRNDLRQFIAEKFGL